jgi:hypothetical protein
MQLLPAKGGLLERSPPLESLQELLKKPDQYWSGTLMDSSCRGAFYMRPSKERTGGYGIRPYKLIATTVKSPQSLAGFCDAIRGTNERFPLQVKIILLHLQFGRQYRAVVDG